jgi:molecular chaperone GrpE
MSDKKDRKNKHVSEDKEELEEEQKEKEELQGMVDEDGDELSLEEQLEQCENKCKECEQKYLRALADYKNFENRTIQEKAEVGVISEIRLLKTFIPFLDNLKRAEVFIKDEGLKMIKTDFLRTIEEIGVTEIDMEGKEFDPNVAEVIEVVDVEDEKKENIVTEVVLSAYKYRDKVLRHGQVKVGKKS